MERRPWLMQDKHLAVAVRGAIGGVFAGLVFGGLNMWFAADAGLPAVTPLHMIATIVQDDARFDAGTTSATVGLIVHVALSVSYGAIFGFFAPEMRSGATRALAAIVYGGAIYVLNFLLLSPAWYPVFQRANQPLEGTVHLLFGALLLPFVARWGVPEDKPTQVTFVN